MYRLYNPNAINLTQSRDVTWNNWVQKDPRSDINLFEKTHIECNVPCINEVEAQLEPPISSVPTPSTPK